MQLELRMSPMASCLYNCASGIVGGHSSPDEERVCGLSRHRPDGDRRGAMKHYRSPGCVGGIRV